MPDLFDVSNHYDDIAIADGYTGAALYNGQFSTFLESSPDGSTSARRTLSLAPNLAVPTRRAITALGETWLIGAGNVDGIYGRIIRQSFWTKKVTDTFERLTPGQAALASVGTVLYGHKEYLKDTVNGMSNAEYDPFWDIYFAPVENVVKGQFLRVGTVFYRVRTSHLAIDGLTNASSDELDVTARVIVVFEGTGAYDPITDTFAAGTTTTYGMLLDRYKSYDLLTDADEKNHPGDMTLYIAGTAFTPIAGKTCTVDGMSWNILEVTAELDAWALHLRKN